jgi:large subunit ribosomal protein L10
MQKRAFLGCVQKNNQTKEVHKIMAKVEQKKTIVEEITNHVKDAQCVVLVNYSGLTVEQDTILRKEFREAGIVYKVYKNTMMNFAFKGTSCESLTEHLHGTNALAISADDATAPARILSKYAKQYPALEMIAGVVEGNYNDQAGMQALASIPSREELLGKLLGSIQSPISNLARVLNQVAEAGGAEAAMAAKPAEEAPAAE